MRRGPSESRPAEWAKGAAELEKSTDYLRHSKDGNGVLWPPRVAVKNHTRNHLCCALLFGEEFFHQNFLV